MSSHRRQADLVQRARGGDDLALTMLLTDSRRRICSYLAGKIPADLRSTIDPDDVVQDAHVEVYNNIHRLDSNAPEAFDRWVKTISIRKLRDRLRRRRAAKRGGGKYEAKENRVQVEDSMIGLLDLVAVSTRTPSRSVARAEAIEAVQAALDELPEHYRQAIWMTHIAGVPVAETARRMGRTERAIHGLNRRGMKILGDLLGSSTKFLSSSG